MSAIIALVSLGTIIIVVSWRLRVITKDKQAVPSADYYFGQWQLIVDQAYSFFASFFRWLGRASYFYSLIIARELAVFAKYMLLKVERRCSRVIDSLRGKSMLAKRGSASSFLAELRSHQKKVLAKFKTE